MSIKHLTVFGALLCAAPAPLLAQDLTPSGDRILSDPTYLPLRGQVEGDTTYGYASLSSSTSNGTTGGTASNSVTQSLDYGVLDDVTIGVSDSYGWSHRHSTSPTGVTSNFSSNGFSDPSFGVTWRALDERRQQPLDLDLSVDYAPDVIRAMSEAPLQTGTTAGGHDLLGLRAAVGWETRSLTLQGYFADDRVGDATTYTPKGFIATQSYWQPVVGVNTQVRFTPRLSLNVDGSYDFGETADEFNSANGVLSIHQPGNSGTINAAFNYHFIPNKLVGSVGYFHDFYAASSTVYPFDPALDSSLQRSDDGLNLIMRYVF
jgi:hypothetical protein